MTLFFHFHQSLFGSFDAFLDEVLCCTVGVEGGWYEYVGIGLVCWYYDEIVSLSKIVEKLVDLSGDSVAWTLLSLLFFIFYTFLNSVSYSF